SSLGSNIDEIRGLASTLTTSSHALTTDIRSLSSLVESGLLNTQGRIAEIAEKLTTPRARARVAKAYPTDTTRPPTPGGPTTVSFARDGSLSGAYIMYALLSAHLSKKPLDVDA